MSPRSTDHGLTHADGYGLRSLQLPLAPVWNTRVLSLTRSPAGWFNRVPNAAFQRDAPGSSSPTSWTGGQAMRVLDPPMQQPTGKRYSSYLVSASNTSHRLLPPRDWPPPPPAAPPTATPGPPPPPRPGQRRARAGAPRYMGGAGAAGSSIHDYYIAVTALNEASTGLNSATSPALLGFTIDSHTIARATIICPAPAPPAP